MLWLPLLSASIAVTADICAPIQRVNCPGNDIGSPITVHTVAECCAHCKATAGCNAWSWNSGGDLGCYAKRRCPSPSNTGANAHCTSGSTTGIPTPAPTPPPPPAFPWLDPSVPTAQRVSMLIGNLTIAEKIKLMGTSSSAIPRLNLPSYAWWSEGAHGVAWAGVATVFPALVGAGASFDLEAVSAMGRAIGMEGRAKHNDRVRSQSTNSPQFYGLDFFAPNINIVRDVRWGRGQETFGEDTFLTSALGVALIRGLQGNASYGEAYPLVGATAKHFFAYNLESNFSPSKLFPQGGTDGQYRLRADINVSETDLRQTYLPAFDAAIVKGEARAVMCSYNSVNGIPACAHPMLQTELRARSGFQGYIVSDCGAIGWMGPSKHNYTSDDAHSSAAGLKAGCDMDCGSAYGDGIAPALAAKLITTEDVDLSLKRTLTARFEMGALDPVTGVNPYQDINMSVVDSKEHRALALRLATESIVLLKNDKKNALPNVVASAKTIAVLGPNANRTMTLLSNYPGCKLGPGKPIDPACHLVNPLQGIMKRAARVQTTNAPPSVIFAQGCEIDGNDTSQIAAAVAAAKEADVAIFVGGIITCQESGLYCQEAEAKDRVNITLPGEQLATLQAVAATGTPIILVIMGGATVSVPWAAAHPSITSIVQLWYPGEEGGTALASILFGDENPSGRMSETVFTGLDQLPKDYLSVTMSDAPGRTHRYLSTTPLYAFGFGLSYTERKYADLKLSNGATLSSSDAAASVTVSATVACVAGPPGDEVVQLYTALQSTRDAGKQSIPLRELKGFTRVALGGCGAAGEAHGGDAPQSATVSFVLAAADLALVDADGTMRAIAGTYDLYVGGTGPLIGQTTSVESGAPAPLHATLTVTK